MRVLSDFGDKLCSGDVISVKKNNHIFSGKDWHIFGIKINKMKGKPMHGCVFKRFNTLIQSLFRYLDIWSR